MLSVYGILAIRYGCAEFGLGSQRDLALIQDYRCLFAIYLFAEKSFSVHTAHAVFARRCGLNVRPRAAKSCIFALIRFKQHKSAVFRLIAKCDRFALEGKFSEANSAQREIAKQHNRSYDQQHDGALDAYFEYSGRGKIPSDLFLICLVNHKSLRKIL